MSTKWEAARSHGKELTTPLRGFFISSLKNGKMVKMRKETNSIIETEALASDFLKTLKKKDKAVVIGLKGDLGSGKTTFVKGIAKALGLKQTVSSPTFVIEKIYILDNQEFKHLIHIDAYRLESGKELINLGWKEISNDSNNLIFIEWPERIEEILPKDAKEIQFKFINENTREISV